MIVEENRKSILGAKASQEMKLLQVITKNIFTCKSTNVSSGSSPIGQQPLTKHVLAKEYSVVFEGVGILPGALHLEVDKIIPPVQLPTQRIPIAVKDQVKAELDRLVELNIIKPVDSPTEWILATVYAVKKDRPIRLCIDPKPLNQALKQNHYLLLMIDDILPELNHVRFFSVLDAKNGYWHVALDEPSSFLMTFGTPWGRF